MAETGPLLSVVVAAYTVDRRQDLEDLLDSVACQSYRPLEVILIVEKSRELYDWLREHIQKQGDPGKEAYFNPNNAGLSDNRNMGVSKAKGEVLAFVDDDVVLASDWAKEVMATFADDTAIGMTGPARPLWVHQSARWIPEEFHWLISCTSWAPWKEKTPVRNVWGHNMAFRREAFEKAGLFQTAVGLRGLGGPVAEDTEFSLRVQARTGKRLIYNPEAVVWHKVRSYRLGWRYIAQRSYWIGRSRHLMRQRVEGNTGWEPLGAERGLLKRIAGVLPGRIARTAVRRPVDAWRMSTLAVWSLAFVAIGYLSGLRAAMFHRKAVQPPANKGAVP